MSDNTGKNPRKGLFIALEGTDGAGKTTQAEMLRARLEAAGHEVVSTREPTSGKWGMKIREIAKHGRAGTTLEEETSWFVEDRRQHVEEVVAPALARGAVVITDRYYYSNIAYQGALGGDVEWLRSINEKENNFPRPDIVFLFQISPSDGIHRINSGRDGANTGYEREDYLEKVRAIFESFTDDNIIRINASREREVIADEIASRVAALGIEV